MNKKLTAKVQKLNANLSEVSRAFSNATVINPDDDNALEKHGILYTIYDVIGSADLDTLLVTKIVHDVLHDSYFQAENTSPIQSLEKAVIGVRDKVIKLSKESSGKESEFNILVAALWGNVLYLVQYGKGGSYLMREGNVKPIQAASEGNFTVASGVVKDGDVVIIGTKKFLEMYTPESLVNNTNPISQHDLPIDASALILMFNVTADFSEKEVLTIGTPDVSVENNQESTFVPSKTRASVATKSKPKFSIKIPSLTTPKIKLKPSLSHTGSTRNPVKLILPVVALLFVVSLIFTFKGNKDSATFVDKYLSFLSKKEEVLEVAKESVSEDVKAKADGEKIDVAADKSARIVRVDAEVFYDLKLVDADVALDNIAVFDNSLAVSDKTTGKIYVSSLSTSKFEAVPTSFPGVGNLGYFGGDLSFTDSEGFKVYDVTEEEVLESYADDTLGAVAASYLDFVYSINGDVLSKYVKSGDGFTSSTWGQQASFEGVKSLSIAVDVYLLKADGSLESYTGGEKTTFTVTGIGVPFRDPKQVLVDLDFENIYVADPGNKRVVVLDEDGALIRQFKHVESGSWDDIKAIGVSRDESILYVISGTKVYEVDLNVLDIANDVNTGTEDTTDTE